MIRVTDIASHRNPEQLSTEVVFEPRTNNLLAIVQIFRADESNDRIDQQRLKLACDRVGSCFQRLLVDTVMSVCR